jgi:hypothetical protein
VTERRAARGARAFLRLAIAALLLATAAGKLLDVPGFAAVLATYRAVPEPLLLPLAVSIPLLEIVLAAWLLAGRRLRLAALASAALHASYGAFSAGALARGISVPNCGCFGVLFARPLSWGTVLEDGILVAASLALAALARPGA